MDGTNPKAGVRYSKDVIYSCVLIFSVVVTLAAGGAAYWYYWIRQDFSAIYAQLGISLPLSVELEPNISKRLEQLRHEPCYRDGIGWLANELTEAGYPREADTSLLSFAKRCGESKEILRWRHAALLKASDFATALDVANHLVESDPASATNRYMRAQTYEQLNNYDAALGDYIVTVQYMGPSRAGGSLFFAIARMHAALGRFCEAIADVETFVAFDPASRRTHQSDSRIIEYSKKGDCGASHARGNARMPLTDAGGVKVLTAAVNGVYGTFIVDSGATYLSMTTAFSDKAKINPNAAVRIPMKTVGGTVQAAMGTAGLVKVGNAEARNVTVAVIQDSRDPFGARIDGLLGISFLARFNMQLGPDFIDLKVRNPEEADANPVQKNQNGPAKRTR